MEPDGTDLDSSASAAGLTARQRDLLDFERTWWQFDEPRDDLIRARFDCTPDEYYAELSRVLELPAAMAHDPLVVRRFHRRRLRRRKMRTDTSNRPPSPAAGSDR